MFLPPSLLSWLSENTDLVPFIEVESFPSNISPEEKDEKLKEFKRNREGSANELLAFSTEQLIITEPEKSESNRPQYDSAKRAIFLYHVLCFIQKEIFMNHLKSFNNSLRMCSNLISLLQSPDFPENFGIKINTLDLYRKLLQESNSTLKLRFRYQNSALEYNRCLSDKIDLESLISILRTTIITCQRQSDKYSTYFYPNNADQRLQQIIMCPSSPVREDYEKFISEFQKKDRHSFIHSMNEIFAKIADVFNVSTKEDCSVLMLLLVRATFSLAYSINPSYFYSDTVERREVDPHKVLCRQICAEINMLSQEELNQPVASVFGCKDFAQPVMYITFAAFHVNPIDALFEVNEALGLTKRAVANRLGLGNNDVLPFEQLFGPMIGVLMSTDIKDFYSLGNFLVDFAPKSELAPELEFSLVTIQAIMKYLETFNTD